MAPLAYTPLRNPKTQVRLFEVFPGRGRLRGCLNHSELDAVKGAYDALSYCWGSQTRSEPIVVNGCTWLISENLNAALKSIRRQHQGQLIMWIDALCINQADTEEKNTQVPMMRDIYFEARRTYVWLGPHDVWTALGFRQIKMRAAWERKHGEGRAELGWWQWRQVDTGLDRENQAADTEGFLVHLMAKAPLTLWIANDSVLYRPWFSRCWIVQEMATSRAITVVCGKYNIDWSDLETTFRALYHSGYDDIRTLVSIRQGFHNSDCGRLETLLWRTNTFQATDPRDRIFSLLGLTSRGAETAPNDDSSPHSVTQDEIRVDYNASIRDVYIEATLQCLTRTKHAGILAAGLGTRKTSLGDFPSWMLNPTPTPGDPPCQHLFAWAVPPSTTSQPWTGGWRASGTSECEIELDRQNNAPLGLQGIVVDVVDVVGAERERLPPASGRLLAIAEQVRTGAANLKCYFQWRALAGVGTEQFYRGTAQTTEQAFLEIMCPRAPAADGDDAPAAERHWRRSRQFNRFVTSNFQFMERRTAGDLRMRELARIVGKGARVVIESGLGMREDLAAAADFETTDILSVNRRFIKTKKGYIGLGGTHAAAGDNVVLFAGSAAPFLVRPSSLGRYKIVSDAYFVQMMNGELWDPGRCGMIWLE